MHKRIEYLELGKALWNSGIVRQRRAEHIPPRAMKNLAAGEGKKVFTVDLLAGRPASLAAPQPLAHPPCACKPAWRPPAPVPPGPRPRAHGPWPQRLQASLAVSLLPAHPPCAGQPDEPQSCSHLVQDQAVMDRAGRTLAAAPPTLCRIRSKACTTSSTYRYAREPPLLPCTGSFAPRAASMMNLGTAGPAGWQRGQGHGRAWLLPAGGRALQVAAGSFR